MSDLTATLQDEENAARARAVKTLLRHPFLHRAQAAAPFDDIRRQHDWLKRYFHDACGWPLTIDVRAGFARLAKLTDTSTAHRRAMTKRADSRPFDAYRYTLMALVPAVLIKSGEQITLDQIGRDVADLVRTNAFPAFDADSTPDKRILVDAVNHLIDNTHVLTVQHVSGDYATGTGTTLYNVNHRLIPHALIAPRSPAGAASIPEMLHEDRYGPYPDPLDPGAAEAAVTPEQRALRIRHTLMRRLLDDPVVYFDTLTDDELDHLQNNADQLVTWLQQAGFTVERRKEGWAAIDADAIATETEFPGYDSVASHAALRLLDHLLSADEAAETPGRPQEVSDAVTAISELQDQYPKWGKAFQGPTGATRLTDEALRRLEAHALVTRDRSRVTVLPAAYRFRATVSG